MVWFGRYLFWVIYFCYVIQQLVLSEILKWIQDDFLLSEVLLVGPFDFTVKHYNMQGTK